MAGPFTIETSYPAPTDVQSQFPTHEQEFRSTVWAWLTFLSSATNGIINEAALPASVDHFDSGTALLFYQAAAPTGWTGQSPGYDHVVRVVDATATGTQTPGGTNSTDGVQGSDAAFGSARTPAGTISSVTTTGAANSHVLTATEMPAHTHGVSGTTSGESADHTHTFSGTTGTESNYHQHNVAGNTGGESNDHTHNTGFGDGSQGSGTYTTAQSATGITHQITSSGVSANHTHAFNVNSGNQNVLHTHSYSGTTSGNNVAHSHTFSVTSGSAGSGGGHSHTLTMNAHNHTFTGTGMDFRVFKINVLHCVKD